MKQKNIRTQKGFTLLELVVVVAVLGLIANLATEFVAQNTNQERFEATKSRQTMIRQAILGTPSEILYGVPNIDGFIADIGHPPMYLRELLTSSGYCPNPEFLNSETNCNDAATASGKPDEEWRTGLGPKWNGPYISGFDLVSTKYNDMNISYPVLRDAWGNTFLAWAKPTDDEQTKLIKDVLNFGWKYEINTSSGHIYLYSAGLNGQQDPEDNNYSLQTDNAGYNAYHEQSRYEQDLPRTMYVPLSTPSNGMTHELKKEVPLIAASEYRLNKASFGSDFSIEITVNNLESGLCPRIWRGFSNVRSNIYTSSEILTSPIVLEFSELQEITDQSGFISHGVFNIDIADCSTMEAVSRCAEDDLTIAVSSTTSLISPTSWTCNIN